MKHLWKIGLIVIALFVLASCSDHEVLGNGKEVTQTRALAIFTHIKVSGIYHVMVTSGQMQSVQITTDSYITPLVRTRVKKGELSIDTLPGYVYTTAEPATIKITLKDLQGIAASGASYVMATNIASNKFTLKTDGAARVKISGHADDVNMHVSGAGHVYAQQLLAKNLDLKVSGAADVHVYVMQTFNVQVSGAGHVTYSGSPKNIKKVVSGAGRVSKD